MPLSSFLLLFHEPITLILLGENWIKYSELLGVFGLLIPVSAIFQQCCRVFIIYNKPKLILFYELLSFTIIYGILFFIGLEDLLLFTYVRVGVEQITCISLLIYISLQYTNTQSMLKLFLGILCLLFACFISFFSTMLFEGSIQNYFGDFLLQALLFFSTFYLCVLLQHIFILRRFSEWFYIESLLKRALQSLKIFNHNKRN
jgi:hypothetical protein